MPKVVESIASIGSSVVGIMEVQNTVTTIFLLLIIAMILLLLYRNCYQYP